MTPEGARAILDATRGWSRSPTTAQAAAALRVWLRAEGYQADRWGNFKHPAKPNERWHFSARAAQCQKKPTGYPGWVTTSRRSTIVAALDYARQAAEALGEAAPGLQKVRAARELTREKAAVRRARVQMHERAQVWAMRMLEHDDPVAAHAALRAGRMDAQTAERFEGMMYLATILVASASLDDCGPLLDMAPPDLDAPSLLPFYYRHADARFEVQVVEDGVDQKVWVEHRGPAARRSVVATIREGDVLLWTTLDDTPHGKTTVTYARWMSTRGAATARRVSAVANRLFAGYGATERV